MKVELDHFVNHFMTLTALAGLFGVQADPALGTIAGVALGLDKVLIDAKKAESSLAEKQGAYLIRLQSRSQPGNIVSMIRKASGTA